MTSGEEKNEEAEEDLSEEDANLEADTEVVDEDEEAIKDVADTGNLKARLSLKKLSQDFPDY